MLDKMRVLGRTKLMNGPLNLSAGDTLRVTYGYIDGRGSEQTLVTTDLVESQAMTVDEAVLFEGEFEGRRALGGLVLEQNRS